MADVEATSGPATTESKRSTQVFNAQAISSFLAMLGTGCGIAFMLLFGALTDAKFEFEIQLECPNFRIFSASKYLQYSGTFKSC
jgi:hypothetical protein